jgi:transposase
MTTDRNGSAFALADEPESARMSTDMSSRSRVEVIRTERRRRWSLDQKRAIVAETRIAGASLAGIARKHGIGTGQLYSWRRRLLTEAMSFARVELIDTDAPVVTMPIVPAVGSTGLIEITLANGACVRVDAKVDERALRRVLKVLRER